jgi:hypothetical protein
MTEPRDGTADGAKEVLNYSPVDNTLAETSTFAVVSALVAVLPSPCCTLALFRAFLTPASVPPIHPLDQRWLLILYSALPSLACVALNWYADVRIRRSPDGLRGRGWALLGMCFSVAWCIAAFWGIGLVTLGP